MKNIYPFAWTLINKTIEIMPNQIDWISTECSMIILQLSFDCLQWDRFSVEYYFDET